MMVAQKLGSARTNFLKLQERHCDALHFANVLASTSVASASANGRFDLSQMLQL